MNAREDELTALYTLYKMNYGFSANGRKRVIAEELIHALTSITDGEWEQGVEICSGNEYQTLYKLLISKMLMPNP